MGYLSVACLGYSFAISLVIIDTFSSFQRGIFSPDCSLVLTPCLLSSSAIICEMDGRYLRQETGCRA